MKSINEQVTDLQKMEIRVLKRKGYTDDEIAKLKLMRILSSPASTSSKLLDYILERERLQKTAGITAKKNNTGDKK